MHTRRPVRRKGDSAARIYEQLRARILSLAWEPGAAVDEAALVREFGVSRTPIREALVRLASEGLVTLLPNRGSQVAPLDLTKIRDYLEAIDICQRAVTCWAALRRRPDQLQAIKRRAREFESAVRSGDNDAMVLANRAFHISIADACGNQQMAAAYLRLLDEGLRISRFTLNTVFENRRGAYREFVETVCREHADMVTAIEAQDAERAEALAASHTERTRRRFADFLADTLSTRIDVRAVS
jgi:DNA-binding GntR family transcriptional regulator